MKALERGLDVNTARLLENDEQPAFEKQPKPEEWVQTDPVEIELDKWIDRRKGLKFLKSDSKQTATEKIANLRKMKVLYEKNKLQERENEAKLPPRTT